jgi:DNA modification methylase
MTTSLPSPFISDLRAQLDIRIGDARQILATMPDECVDCVVTSPPYWGLRDYGHDDQMGREATPDAYIADMVALFREVRRVLKPDGTCWVNLGDSYSRGGTAALGSAKQERNAGSYAPAMRRESQLPPKNLVGIPWRFALAAQADGWILRQDIIWHKPNPMPESVKDRCTKAHEYVFLLVKSARYRWDADAIKEPTTHSGEQLGLLRRRKLPRVNARDTSAIASGNERPGAPPYVIALTRARRSVWTVSPSSFADAHFATFPPNLIRPMIRAGCRPDGVVLDPFLGSGTTAMVALQERRRAIGIELNSDYAEMARQRCVPFINNQLPFILTSSSCGTHDE